MPTAIELANTTAAWVDAQYRVFTSPDYARLLAAGIASLDGWTDPDTGLLSEWTEITDRVSWAGNLTFERNGSAVTWTAELHGTNYDSTYLAIGLAVMVWVRYWTPDSGWQTWQREYLGQFVNRSDRDDFRAGREWQRTVTGTNHSLDRYNAPRLRIGPIQVTEGSSVDASTALASPDLERDRGEFTGGVASVAASNVVDGKIETVYISNATPAHTNPGLAGPWEDGAVVVSEVFFKPVSGWDLSKCWWVEVYNMRSQNSSAGFSLKAACNTSHDEVFGGTYQIVGGWPQQVSAGRFAIICANRDYFDRYVGDASGAEWVEDASKWNPDFILDPDDGYVGTIGPYGVAWAPGGANRKYEGWDTGAPHWNSQATVNSSLITDGCSIIRDMTITSQVNALPGWYSIEPDPSPGGVMTPNTPVYVKVSLPENTTHLTQSCNQASMTIQLDNYLGWLSSGKGIVEAYIFSYTGRDLTGLTGVTWDTGGAHSHSAGAQVYPYANSIAQTGYPVHATKLIRRKRPVPEHYEVFWSWMDDPRYYNEDAGWRSDYYAHSHNVQGNQALRLTDNCADGTNAYLWVRSFMYVIHCMSRPMALLTAAVGASSTSVPMDITTEFPNTGSGTIEEDSFTWTGKTAAALTGVTGLSTTHAAGTLVICDPGRVMINELIAELPQTAFNWSGLPDMDGARSADLAGYLCRTVYGMATADFVDQSTTLAHQIGNQATAITRLSDVLADLARNTGCLVVYGTDGRVYWQDDPWWPMGNSAWPTYLFDRGSMRGQLEFREAARQLDYVIVNATSLEGDDGPHAVRFVWPLLAAPNTEPPLGKQAQEVSGFVVATDSQARWVAESQWRQLAFMDQCRFTVKGIGEWCRPGMWVGPIWDWDGSGIIAMRAFLIERVTRTRTVGADGKKSMTTDLECRRYRWGT